MERKNNNPCIKLSKEQKEEAIIKIKAYCCENLDIDLGDLAADLYLDFIIEELGSIIYNQGISDAQTFFQEKVDDVFMLLKE